MLIREMVPPAVTVHTSLPTSLRLFFSHFVLGNSSLPLPLSVSRHPSVCRGGGWVAVGGSAAGAAMPPPESLVTELSEHTE